mmetsp:Transcript_34481/g.97268  ORF Transcript_34481/g.97268 Transcript_34481/m.97268 type:complete len:310 (+) Transcript_34481:566-1495(+)
MRVRNLRAAWRAQLDPSPAVAAAATARAAFLVSASTAFCFVSRRLSRRCMASSVLGSPPAADAMAPSSAERSRRWDPPLSSRPTRVRWSLSSPSRPRSPGHSCCRATEHKASITTSWKAWCSRSRRPRSRSSTSGRGATTVSCCSISAMPTTAVATPEPRGARSAMCFSSHHASRPLASLSPSPVFITGTGGGWEPPAENSSTAACTSSAAAERALPSPIQSTVTGRAARRSATSASRLRPCRRRKWARAVSNPDGPFTSGRADLRWAFEVSTFTNRTARNTNRTSMHTDHAQASPESAARATSASKRR